MDRTDAPDRSDGNRGDGEACEFPGDWQATVEGLGRGEREAFDELFRVLETPLLRVLWRALSADDARDIAQDVFVKLYEAALAGRAPSDGRFVSWRKLAIRSAKNALVDHLRRRGVRTRWVRQLVDLTPDDPMAWQSLLPDSSAQGQGLDELLDAELARAMERCLEELEGPWRSVLWDRHVEGISKREIARRLELPEATLRHRLGRAEEAVRECLEREGMDGEAA